MQLSGDDVKDLSALKKCVINYEKYFRENIERYMWYMRFLMVNTVSKEEEAALGMDTPPLSFNQLDAIGCAVLGEFNAQEPGITVSVADGVISNKVMAATAEAVECHMRHDLDNTNNSFANSTTFERCLYGGYGAMEVSTEYMPNSFLQQIKHEPIDPVMVGFDPMATTKHKGDGDYCYKKIFMTEDSVRVKFGKKVSDSITYAAVTSAGSSPAFSWSYENTDTKVAVIIEFYYKEETSEKWVKLSNGEEMTRAEYNKQVKEWDEADVFVPPPEIRESKTEITTEIKRVTFCESQIIDREDTIHEMLPIVFFDGRSALVQADKGGCIMQVTRPYFYNARDAQKFKDYAGQSYAAALQARIKSQLLVSDTSVPDQLLDPYLEPQKNSVLRWKAYYNDDPNFPNPKPETITVPDMPQSVMSAFVLSDKLIQTTMGNYETQIAMQPDVSGRAIKEGAMQSDAAVKPYFDNFYECLDRVAQIKLNLLPKVYKTPRSMPVTLRNGKKSCVIINSQDINPQDKEIVKQQKADGTYQQMPVDMNYSPSDLLIKVSSGPNSAIQKRTALDQITKLMDTSPVLNGLFSGPCVGVLLDNVADFRGLERVKSEIGPYQKQQQQQQEQTKQMQEAMQQMQMQMQQLQGMVMQAQANKYNAEAQKTQTDSFIENKKVDNKESMDVANMILDRQKESDDFNIDAAKIILEKEKNTEAVLLARQQLASDQVDQVLEAVQIDAEQSRHEDTHLLEISKHEHEKDMSERALQSEKESALSPVKND